MIIRALLSAGIMLAAAGAVQAGEESVSGRDFGGQRPNVTRQGPPPVARPQPGPTYRPAPPPPISRPVPGYRPPPPPVARPRPPVIIYTPPPSLPLWRPGFHPYEARYHDTCQRKAWRLRWFERRAADDGYLSWSERQELSALRRDLRRTCGDWRWRD